MVSVNMAFQSILCRAKSLTYFALVTFCRLQMLGLDVLQHSGCIFAGITTEVTSPVPVLCPRHIGSDLGTNIYTNMEWSELGFIQNYVEKEHCSNIDGTVLLVSDQVTPKCLSGGTELEACWTLQAAVADVTSLNVFRKVASEL